MLRAMTTLLTLIYAAASAAFYGMILAVKMGKAPANLLAKITPDQMALIKSIAQWQLGVGLLAVVIYVIAALRLMSRPRGVFPIYLVAVLVDLGGWVMLKRNPLFDKALTQTQMMVDYGLIALVLLLGIVYLSESVKRVKRTPPAVLGG